MGKGQGRGSGTGSDGLGTTPFASRNMPVQSTGASPFGAGSGLTSTFRPAVNVTERTGRNARLQHNVMPPSMSRARAEMRPTASAEPKEEFAAKRLSEEESIRSDEQKVLEKLASPRVFIPNEVPRGKRTREGQAQYLLDSYKSEDLTLLFAEAGLDFFNPDGPLADSSPFPSYLPVEMFDAVEEALDFAAWNAVQRTHKYAKSIPARALFSDSNGCGEWRCCEMLDWNDDENKFFVQWPSELNEPSQQAWLSRLEICFDCEDPSAFVARVAQAYKDRAKTESRMRFDLYIKNMPTDGILAPPEEWMDRVVHDAMDVGSLRGSNADVEAPLSEIKTAFVNVQNEMLFRSK